MVSRFKKIPGHPLLALKKRGDLFALLDLKQK